MQILYQEAVTSKFSLATVSLKLSPFSIARFNYFVYKYY